MALCLTCNSFSLCRIFKFSDASSATNVNSDSRYFWHEHLARLCFRHSDNISQIHITASAGCGLCTLLFDAFTRKEAELAQEAGQLPIILARGVIVKDERNDPPRFSPYMKPRLRSFFLRPDKEPIGLCDVDISIDNASVELAKEIPLKPFIKLHSHAYDPSCVALASRWLSSCLESHDCPAPNLTGPSLLTRFLHVENGSINIRLVEFPPGASLQPWVALSYRWGEKKPLVQLEQNTIKNLKKVGTKISELDEIIQAAISISMDLGIQYLWVDVLCILQGQDSDWLEQSSQMNYIYGHSTVTIASVDTDGFSQSFLRPRETQYIEIPWKADPNQDASQERRKSSHFYVSQRWPDQNDQLIGPWSKRAWTLQEELLSNRILFYSSHQIAWKCCSEVVYERGPQHVPLTEFYSSIADLPGGRPFWKYDLFTQFKLLPDYLGSPECLKPHGKYLIWYNVIEDYSARCLKYPRDRLVAISGIAKEYSTVLDGDRYVAGLWQSDMLPGLLWYVEGLELLGRRVGESIDHEVKAPSWSWASAPSGYTIKNDWKDKELKELATLEDVQFGLVEPNNPFGGVSHAKVTIRGRLYRFSQLYHPTWRSQGSGLSPFERHLSHMVELDYGERANEFSREDHYAALLLVQQKTSYFPRFDALVLETLPSPSDERATVWKRLGVLQLRHYRKPTIPPLKLRKFGAELAKSLDLRRSKPIFCKEDIQNYDSGKWLYESVTIV